MAHIKSNVICSIPPLNVAPYTALQNFVCALLNVSYLESNTHDHDMWVPVTKAYRVLRLRMEEQTPIWKVDASVWNKQLRTTDKERFSSFGVGRSAKKYSP
jgi:hypothetical protein